VAVQLCFLYIHPHPDDEITVVLHVGRILDLGNTQVINTVPVMIAAGHVGSTV
jgi:hypothetical protein